MLLLVLIAVLMPRSGSKFFHGSTDSVVEQAEGQSTNIAASAGAPVLQRRL